MPYRTLDDWCTFFRKSRRKLIRSKSVDVCQAWFCFLFDLDELTDRPEVPWAAPVMQAYSNWCEHYRKELRFNHGLLWPMIRDFDHYQRVGALAARHAAHLHTAYLHPGNFPQVDAFNQKVDTTRLLPLWAVWQADLQENAHVYPRDTETLTALLAEHRNFLYYNTLWDGFAQARGLAAAWPVFLHYERWGVPTRRPARNVIEALLVPNEQWRGFAAVPTFVTWCFLQWAADRGVTAMAWTDWVANLPLEHAAHSLNTAQAFLAYSLWAPEQPGVPDNWRWGPLLHENWIWLLQLLEQAQAPTGEGLADDLVL